MTAKFGVSLDDELADAVEEYRIQTDPDTGKREVIGRSQSIRELLRLGVIADSLISDADELSLDRGRPREAFVRQAILNELRREFDD